MNEKKERLILLLIILIAACLRFSHLDWGNIYPFNPDERNMAVAIMRLEMPKLDPHFFAYNQFPLYLVYFTYQVFHGFSWQNVTSNFATLGLRFYSALTSVFIIFLVFLTVKKLTSNSSFFAILASLLTAFSPGLIQAAHFGTTESLLAFLLLLTLWLSFRYLEKKRLIYLFFSGICIGTALGTKISALTFSAIPLAAIFILFLTDVKSYIVHFHKLLYGWKVLLSNINSFSQEDVLSSTYRPNEAQSFVSEQPRSVLIQAVPIYAKKNRKRFFLLTRVIFYLFSIMLLFTVTMAVALATSPHILINYQNTRSALRYEEDVATGRYQAFYTRQFIDSKPLLFQFKKIFPYTLGPFVLLLAIPGMILSFLKLNRYTLLLIFAFLTNFLPVSSFFTKWTRFTTPSLSLLIIFAVLFFYKISDLESSFSLFNVSGSNKKGLKRLFSLRGLLFAVICLTSASTLIYGLAFFGIYQRDDVRISASEWIYKNLEPDAYVLAETANVVDIPIPGKNTNIPSGFNPKIISFDFYHLHENEKLFPQLLEHLENADYIFIPSRRLFANFPQYPDKFPQLAKYYELLFSGKLGFEKIAQFESFPKLSLGKYSLVVPDEMAEETLTVFDHPVIRIYQKTKMMTKEEYERLFDI